MKKPILEMRKVRKFFPVRSGLSIFRNKGLVKAVDGVSFSIDQGESFGLVGESGSGKSTLGRLVLRVLAVTSGELHILGYNVNEISKRHLVKFRRNVQAVYQNPYGSLNPRMKVGAIIGEPLEVNRLYSRKERRDRVISLLERVGLSAEQGELFPHEFSGGQRQRIGIARALSTNPSFIVLDEPVSALDVSIRAQILNLLADLKEEFGLTYLFISHDLSIVEHFSDRVGVLYLGRMVELANKTQLFTHAAHPYTQALLSAVPVADPDVIVESITLSGEIPSPINPPLGCHFNTRCLYSGPRCAEDPPSVEIEAGHFVYCHFPR